MGVIDFSFSFQLWQTARQYESDRKEKQYRKNAGSGKIITPKTNSSEVKVLREPSKVLRW